MSVLRSFRFWLACLAAVALLALVSAPGTSTRASRVARLESLVRCPSCEDISVAQSNATSAVAVRREIESKVRRGLSDSTILTSLESTYGPTILLSPSTSGVGALLWAVPLAGVGVAGAVALGLARRR